MLVPPRNDISRIILDIYCNDKFNIILWGLWISEIIFLHAKLIYISYLKFYSSLVCDVCLVSSQSDHYVRTGLSLQLLHPVFRSYKSVLIAQQTLLIMLTYKLYLQTLQHAHFCIHLWVMMKMWPQISHKPEHLQV